MSDSIGPIRFNNVLDAEIFRDWALSVDGEDVRELEDSDVQAYFDKYQEHCRKLLEAYRPMTHADYSWCDPEAGNLCPACKRTQRIEAEDARRLYEGSKLDPSLGTYAEQMRDAGRGHLLRGDER